MKILLLIGLLIIGGSALAMAPVASDVVVIVNKGNDNQVDRSFVVKVYTGEAKTWSNGGAITALDLPEDSPVRVSFTSRVLGKSVSSMKSLWTEYVFSGKATPPKQLGSDEEVKKIVGSNKNAIGYIRASSLDDTVKAVIK
jgi:ABC-type phosphate transport system substrate-binding protein